MGRGVVSSQEQLFGRIAVALGLITPRQLKESLLELCLQPHASSLSRLLLAKGYIKAKDLPEILHYEAKKRRKWVDNRKREAEELALGQAVLEEGLLSLDRLEEALLEKKRLARKGLRLHIGDVLISRSLVPEDHVRRILARRRGEVRECPDCHKTFHTANNTSSTPLRCPECNGELEPAAFIQPIETDGELK